MSNHLPTFCLALLTLLWPVAAPGADQPTATEAASGRVRLIVAQDAGYPPSASSIPRESPPGIW